MALPFYAARQTAVVAGSRQATSLTQTVHSVSWHSPSPFEQLEDLVHVLWGATFAVSTGESTAT